MQQELFTDLDASDNKQLPRRRKVDELLITQLNRIENKVDKHGEALERLARTEERVTTLLESFKELTIKDNKMDERIVLLEKEITNAKTVGRTWKRVIQIGAASIIFFLGNRYGEIVADLRHFVADMLKGPTP